MFPQLFYLIDLRNKELFLMLLYFGCDGITLQVLVQVLSHMFFYNHEKRVYVCNRFLVMVIIGLYVFANLVKESLFLHIGKFCKYFLIDELLQLFLLRARRYCSEEGKIRESGN